MSELPGYPATILAGIRAAEVDGRLPNPGAERLGTIFPFEAQDLRVVRIEPGTEDERHGETGECRTCTEPDSGYLWTSPTWRLRGPRNPDGVHYVFLEPRVHCDLADLPLPQAHELGPLMQRVERALVTALDGVARVHVHRWGDGGAHLHWWFLARPADLPQFRGSGLATWLDVLPPVDPDVWRSDLTKIAAAMSGPVQS